MGGQRGTEIEITLSGARLGDAQEIIYYQPGITTVSLKKVDDNNVKAKIKIAPDCALGLHDLRVRTATGISELRTFSVGAFKEINEVEPNNDFAAPQPIPMNVTVNGVADNEDVDYFVVEAKKGERISAEVEGLRLGITEFDPYVAILNAKRFELGVSDDAALVWRDGFTSIIAPEDGKYIIQVRESAYAGNGGCLYRLHVGNFPRARRSCRPAASPARPLTVRWIGDPAGETTTTSQAAGRPSSASSASQRQDDKGISPYPNAFRLTPLGNVIEKEPNDDQAHATPFDGPDGPERRDRQAGRRRPFRLQGDQGPGLRHPLLCPADPLAARSGHVPRQEGGRRDAGGRRLRSGPTATSASRPRRRPSTSIWLVDHLGKGGPDYAYRIEVTPVVPQLTMTTNAEQIPLGTGVMSVAVPKGNRQAILIYGNRADFGGELNVGRRQAAGRRDRRGARPSSPARRSCRCCSRPSPMRRWRRRWPRSPASRPIPSSMSRRSSSRCRSWCSGQNNVNVWSRTVDRLAVAVTEECPYTIEIVEPKVPLVRGGSMGLKVRANRKPGFKAAIAVYLPWNPPGVGSAGGIAIPEGQNEAVIPMNADGGAELRTWKIVVNGASGVASGPIMVSSQLANLTIAEPVSSA